jgi:hypothetical protein
MGLGVAGVDLLHRGAGRGAGGQRFAGLEGIEQATGLIAGRSLPLEAGCRACAR